MRVIHVLRKPVSESTVTMNVLKHGVGGINIDVSRIASPGETITNHSRSDESAISKGIYGDSKGQGTHQTEGQKLGRWPANVILQHLDGCRCEGVKRVGAGEGPFVGEGGEVCEAHEGYKRPNSSSYTHKQPGHRKTFGEETLANWICEPGCPVAALDGQSGSTGGWYSADTTTKGRSGAATLFGSANGGGLRNNYNDTGGASRFYKQVGGKG